MTEYKILLKRSKELDSNLLTAKALQEQKEKEYAELCKDLFAKYKVTTVEELKALLAEKQSKVDAIVKTVQEQYPEALVG